MSLNEILVFLPLITAIVTAFLTTIFTSVREKKSLNVSNRIFLEYGEYDLHFPFDKEVPKNLGKGVIYWGENGMKLKKFTEENGKTIYSFLVLNNPTINNAINVNITTEYSCENESVKEVFSLPYWKNDDVIYLAHSIHEAGSHLSRSEKIDIRYTTESFEQFRFSIIRNLDGTYRKKLQKKYFNFFWVTKLNYTYSGLIHTEKVL
ncbi:hypothetical protein [Pseudobacillus badius]|uniref:hypothetical protein n=1 Tax=Bacillus badius TaxID=1455 RepID=UPI0024A46AA6|nr:hypothetical protein [Bacillus badius]GLY10350.1 hypothetical protein Bbad01_15660 [Bacillus badius]